MKTPPERSHDLGLGKKVEPRPIITPDWRAIPGRPHHYEHTSQKNANGTPARKYAPPVPDTPMRPDPALDWYRTHGVIA